MTTTTKETALAEQKYEVRSAPELPKKQWLEPLPYTVRELDANGLPRGRWLRVYRDNKNGVEGAPVVLKQQPTRNTKVHLPANLIPANA